jgi:uncharacterized membrane protein
VVKELINYFWRSVMYKNGYNFWHMALVPIVIFVVVASLVSMFIWLGVQVGISQQKSRSCIANGGVPVTSPAVGIVCVDKGAIIQ